MEPIKPSKRAIRICDECGSVIDSENSIWVPLDLMKKHHPCTKCGLIDYRPRKKIKARVTSRNSSRNWWGNLSPEEKEGK